MLLASLKPDENWGPVSQSDLLEWHTFKAEKKEIRHKRSSSRFKQFIYILLNFESNLD